MSGSVSNSVSKAIRGNSQGFQTSENEFCPIKSRVDCDTAIGKVEM